MKSKTYLLLVVALNMASMFLSQILLAQNPWQLVTVKLRNEMGMPVSGWIKIYNRNQPDAVVASSINWVSQMKIMLRHGSYFLTVASNTHYHDPNPINFYTALPALTSEVVVTMKKLRGEVIVTSRNTNCIVYFYPMKKDTDISHYVRNMSANSSTAFLLPTGEYRVVIYRFVPDHQGIGRLVRTPFRRFAMSIRKGINRILVP